MSISELMASVAAHLEVNLQVTASLVRLGLPFQHKLLKTGTSCCRVYKQNTSSLLTVKPQTTEVSALRETEQENSSVYSSKLFYWIVKTLQKTS